MSKIQYNAALYLRLSKEDGDKDESYSISNQRDLGLDFLKKNKDIKLYDEFVDDGYTGSNFDRPRFKDMMKLILESKINCVIVKDLSRFAREYIDSGYYLEKLFPMLGVRFISINDNIDYKVDSSNNTKLVIAFKNILNDSYIRDTSIKVRSHLEIKRKKGEYIGAFVVFGYRKAEDDKHKIVVDRDAAVIVKRIFALRFMGMSASAIADDLNLKDVLSPSEYKKLTGSKYHPNLKKKHVARWTATSVIRILNNIIYTGTLVQGKTTTVNYKVKKIIEKAPEEWNVIKDNHEAIIPEEFFEVVQKLMKRDTRVSPGRKEPYLFSGFLRCADCGDSLIRKIAKHKDKTYVYYVCARNKLKMGCTPHRISEDVVEESVSIAINTYCKNVSDLLGRINNDYRNRIRAEKIKTLERSIASKTKEIEALNHTIEVVEKRCIDNLESKESCREICTDIRNSITVLEKEIASLTEERNNINLEIEKNISWMKVFSETGEVKELNRTLLSNLVDSIIVYEGKCIEVKFNYCDRYQEMLTLINQVNMKAVV